jgi:hypothetical protein
VGTGERGGGIGRHILCHDECIRKTKWLLHRNQALAANNTIVPA